MPNNKTEIKLQLNPEYTSDKAILDYLESFPRSEWRSIAKVLVYNYLTSGPQEKNTVAQQPTNVVEVSKEDEPVNESEYTEPPPPPPPKSNKKPPKEKKPQPAKKRSIEEINQKLLDSMIED